MESSVIYSYDEKKVRGNESSRDRELYVDVIVSHDKKALPETFILYVKITENYYASNIIIVKVSPETFIPYT